MKSNYIVILSLITILCACNYEDSTKISTTSNTTITEQKVENTQAKKKPIVFNYEGTIKGEEYKSYTIDGKKGQVLTANLNVVKGNADVFLYGYDDFSAGTSYTLPETGKYDVRVVQPKAASFKSSSSTYKLTLILD